MIRILRILVWIPGNISTSVVLPTKYVILVSIWFHSGRDYNEERRSRLREIEVKIMQYQDELESGRRALKSGMTIQGQVEHYRKKLIRKVTLHFSFETCYKTKIYDKKCRYRAREN